MGTHDRQAGAQDPSEKLHKSQQINRNKAQGKETKLLPKWHFFPHLSEGISSAKTEC